MKKTLFLGSLAFCSLPVAIATSCSNNENQSGNNENQTQLETNSVDKITAKDLGDEYINKTNQQFVELVNKNWILQNIDKHLTNSSLIKEESCILDLSANINSQINSAVDISFGIAPGFTFDKDGNVYNEKRNFTVTIDGFKTFDNDEIRANFQKNVKESGFNQIVPLIKNNENNEKVINLGIGENNITLDAQKSAISKYIEINLMQGAKVIYNQNEWNYRISFSAKTNQRVVNLFGHTWNDILNKTNNKDLKNIDLVVLIFKLEPKDNNEAGKTDFKLNSLADFVFHPQYLQFSWPKESKPYWMNPEETSIRINVEDDSRDQKITVKNTKTGEVGSLVSSSR